MRIETVDSIVLGDVHLVRITTDGGLVGLGQSACWAYPAAVDAVIDTFRGYLVGQDPRRIEHHWHHLYRMGPFRGSVLSAAVAAVDIALWDIKGRWLDVPVWELLGGRTRERIRLHLLIWGSGPDELSAQAAEAVADGFTAVKFDPFPRGYQDLSQERLVASARETVAAVREAVGPDVDLLVELHRKLTPLQAGPVIEALAPFHPLLLEDPVQIDSIASQAAVSAGTVAPLASGERMHTIWEFRELLAQGRPQYVRPDVGLAGGLSHCRKIAAIAEAHHAAVVTHNFLGPLLTAASVHLDASIPNFVVQEYSLVDEQPVSRAFTTACRREGGYIGVPEAPGLGVSFDESVAEPMSIVGRAVTDIPLRADGSVAYAV